MTGKPTPAIMTEINPAPAAPGATDLLADLRAAPEAGPGVGDLGALAARPTRRVSVQTLVVALVLTASAGSLYMMRKQGMGAGMKFQTPTVAHEIEAASGQTGNSEQRILADLARSSLPMQGGTEPLQKNPFMLDVPAPEAGGPSVPVRDTNAERLAQIREKLAGIRLNSVMEGPKPLARVNDKLVCVGDIVEEIFLVAQIHDRSVDLIADGRTYTLNMGDAAPSSGGRRQPRVPGGPVGSGGPSAAMQPPRH